jgi:hypothetical protein
MPAFVRCKSADTTISDKTKEQFISSRGAYLSEIKIAGI